MPGHHLAAIAPCSASNTDAETRHHEPVCGTFGTERTRPKRRPIEYRLEDEPSAAERATIASSDGGATRRGCALARSLLRVI